MFVKVQPRGYDREVDSNRINITRAFFQNVRILILFGGINPGKLTVSRKIQWCSKLKTMYRAIVVILYLVSISLFCFETHKRISTAKELTRLFAFFAIFVSSLFLNLLYSHILPKRLPELEQSFDRYEKQYVVKEGVLKLPRHFMITTVTMLLSIYFIYPVEVYILGDYPDILCDAFPACSIPFPWHDSMFYLSVGSAIMMYVQWQGLFLVCVFLSVFLILEFKSVSQQFKDLSISTSDDAERRFDELVSRHESLVDVLDETNSCFQHYFFIVLFSALPVNCSFLLATLSKPLTAAEVIYLSIGMSVALLTTGIRLYVEATVSSMAHEPVQHILKLKQDRFSDRGLHKVSLFLSRLTRDTIGYNIYRLLTITMPTLLGIFGTLATYFIVVVQFRPVDTSSQCEHLIQNMTYCLRP